MLFITHQAPRGLTVDAVIKLLGLVKLAAESMHRTEEVSIEG